MTKRLSVTRERLRAAVRSGRSRCPQAMPSGGRRCHGALPLRRVFLARGLAATAGVARSVRPARAPTSPNSTPASRRPPRRPRPALDGLRIVSFSDGHLSTTYGGRRFERLVEPGQRAAARRRGDRRRPRGRRRPGAARGGRPARRPRQRAGRLLRHRQPRDRGHLRLDAAPADPGVDVLRNERVPIRRGSAAFDLAGIDDRTAARSGLPGHGADLDAALDGRDDDAPSSCWHTSRTWWGRRERPAWTCRSRPHARRTAVAVRLRDPPGPACVQGCPATGTPALHHRGIRLLGPPMRIGARPEVAVVELRAPS